MRFAHRALLSRILFHYVPLNITYAEKYRKKLKDAEIIIYESKNSHFNVPKFPEIIYIVKSDILLR